MNKKILLFLVEGLSDKDALEPILSELVDSTKIHFEVLRCDLTASLDPEVRNLNMKQRITRVIKSFLENNHGIKKKHIEKIIFLSDSDGCYIDDSYIYFSENDISFRYEDDGIYTNRPNDAIDRNQRKSRNLNMIHSTAKVYALPIETYYFSCNLDHVLHNKRNLEQYLKEDYAFDFADKYENKEEHFIDFVNDSSLCLANNYADTWTIIQEDRNSLLRFTNLKIFFDNNFEFLKDEAKERVVQYQGG